MNSMYAGRNFECDYGYVGENGTCVPYEEHITSTPVPSENSFLAQRGSEPTGDDIRNSPLMQALNGIGGGEQPVPAGFEPDPNPEVDSDMGDSADGGDDGMVAANSIPPSTTAPGVGGTGSPTGTYPPVCNYSTFCSCFMLSNLEKSVFFLCLPLPELDTVLPASVFQTDQRTSYVDFTVMTVCYAS